MCIFYAASKILAHTRPRHPDQWAHARALENFSTILADTTLSLLSINNFLLNLY